VLSAICAAQLEDLLLGIEKALDKELTMVIDGKSEQQRNPAYTAWVARDQAVLGYIMSTLTHETLLHISRCPTAAEVWKTLAALYASQTRAWSVNTRIGLTTMKKNRMMVTDDLAASGAPLCDDEFVVYILAVHDEEYNLVFTAIVVRTDPISPSELYAQLLSFEQHTALQMVSAPDGLTFAFAASRGRGSSSRRGAEVVAALHMSDSYTVALTVPPVHLGPNARFA
jgi:tRNA(Met) C34 N-acetyltransferase TmcA